MVIRSGPSNHTLCISRPCIIFNSNVRMDDLYRLPTPRTVTIDIESCDHVLSERHTLYNVTVF